MAAARGEPGGAGAGYGWRWIAAVSVLASLLGGCAEYNETPTASPPAVSVRQASADEAVPAATALPTELLLSAECERQLGVLEWCALRIETEQPEAAMYLRELDSQLRVRLSQLRMPDPGAAELLEDACLQLADDARARARVLPECGAGHDDER